MPMLTRDQQRALLGATDQRCPTCRQWIRKNYCRQCDEFFHECDCTNSGKQPTGHETHRTY